MESSYTCTLSFFSDASAIYNSNADATLLCFLWLCFLFFCFFNPETQVFGPNEFVNKRQHVFQGSQFMCMCILHLFTSDTFMHQV